MELRQCTKSFATVWRRSKRTAPYRRLLMVSLLFVFPCQADTINGKVVAIADGDTITVLQKRQQHKVRLAEIDTPEKKQPYGNKAKQALSDMVFGKTVTVKQVDTDRYGRIVGKVYLDGLYVNAEMVKNGHAWVYRKYAKDQDLYRLEEHARRQKIGLWALQEDQRIPPWEWRHKR